jgi:hypothetical protein
LWNNTNHCTSIIIKLFYTSNHNIMSFF